MILQYVLEAKNIPIMLQHTQIFFSPFRLKEKSARRLPFSFGIIDFEPDF